MPIAIRDFRPEDRAACLALFDGNTPAYFHPGERAAFADCLASTDFLPPRLRNEGRPPGRFFVAVGDDGAVIGCGGWYVDGAEATLSWGMIDRAHHRQGVGRLLLDERLRCIRAEGRARTVRVQTTAPVVGFFERMGFRIVRAAVPGLVDEMPLIELSLALGSGE